MQESWLVIVATVGCRSSAAGIWRRPGEAGCWFKMGQRRQEFGKDALAMSPDHPGVWVVGPVGRPWPSICRERRVGQCQYWRACLADIATDRAMHVMPNHAVRHPFDFVHASHPRDLQETGQSPLQPDQIRPMNARIRTTTSTSPAPPLGQ